ncbi:SusC/RagA family TonB-linked outer membrane protein [Mucilaginibacter ginsenosidivorax]|uniref:TonB-dependent receptor n=1 Tax=Mucilaginibacter ginsenosidivorax TaxID=862126 RepID=A0A5B8W731_9SPHI|nr:TonB-dependent receptor [Mucilaginibacter ginsenosidivorax]QEC79277.1 TonB-dependent receptor [Mucilaginibacter ginsenosidivorax]
MRGKLHIKKFVALIWINLALMLVSMSGYAQSKITGKVTGADDGLPIPGVTVKVKGGPTVTSTNTEGTYSITAGSNATLIFSFIGYTSQEVAVGGNATVNIKLSPENKALNEVVVVGYGSAKRSDVTGAISSVNAATIAKVPVTSLDQALQGRAAGVQVTNNDASPGSNITVLIRGTGSLASGGNTPLYVVDGYPINAGGINNINPSDIASIDVLKDASATAIYGVRAANGVVMVTTKKGKKDGGAQVEFNAYNAFQSKPKQYDLLNAQQFATLANDVAANDPNKHFTTLANWASPSSLTNADWQNAIYRSGLTQNYDLAIRGGNEKVQSSTSIGYYDQKGIVLGSYFKRITVGENLDYQPKKWLKSSTSAKYSYQNLNNPFGTGNLGNINQLPPTLDGGNKLTSQIKDANGNYGFFNPIYTYVAKNNNPIYSIETNQYKNINNYFLVNSSLEATIFDGLKFKTNGGITYTGYNGSYFQPSDSRKIDQYGAAAGASGTALYSQHINSTFDWLWENYLSYDKTFGSHTINFVAGVSEQESDYNSLGGSVTPPNNTIKSLSQGTNLILDANTNGAVNNGEVKRSYASQFARLAYNYASKYYLTGTVRRDGSSQFAPGHQYGTFYSGAVNWNVKKESFLTNVNWLSGLKFRGSYGELGNQHGIGDFTYQSLYSAGASATASGNLGYAFGKVGGSNGTYQAGVASIQPENDNIRWETDYVTDIGMDASFLNGELSLTVDYFNRKSKDFLLNIAASPQTGYNTLPSNVGSMVNKGWEFALNYNHAVNSDVHIDLGLTLSFIKNRLTGLYSGTNAISNFGGLGLTGDGWSEFTRTYIGQPIGEFYGYKAIGIIQNQAQLTALNAAAQAKGNDFYYKATTGVGDRLYADVDGSGKITADDRVALGSPQPKFFGGFNLGGSYKSWDFNAYFYGVYGNKILNYQESNLESFAQRGSVSIENVSKQYYNNYWTPTRSSNRYAAVHYDDTDYGNLLPSSAWIENGSFLKLKTVTVGYSLPQDLVKKLTLSKIRVYVSSQNLFTITKYTGLDPEIGTQNANPTQNGVDNGTYPSSRFYTIGLNVVF